MANLSSFFRAILDDPDDDDVRLVFADWLDDHRTSTSPRAEFIRVQVELTRNGEEHPLWTEWKLREHMLLAEHRADWSSSLRDLGLDKCEFRGGFVQSCLLPADRFIADADQIFELTPLTEATLSAFSWHWRNLADSRYLNQLRKLELRGGDHIRPEQGR